MEADSTGTENLNDDMKFPESNELHNLQSPKVESSQISSCDEETFLNIPSSSDSNAEHRNMQAKTDSIESAENKDMCSDNDFDDGHMSFKNLHMTNIEPGNQLPTCSQNESVNVPDSILNEKDLEHIEESVLTKYTGLNMDLASENQLLKEDVIKCRCELEKYGKKLSNLERKLDRANSYNDDLRVQVDKLSREIHEYRREKHKVFVHADTQTSSEDIMEIEDDTLYDVNLPGLKPECDMSFDWKGGLEEGQNLVGDGDSATQDALQTPGMSIADSLKATAEAAMNQTGFVYDEQSGLYYDYSTGYYYNAEKGLYYDPKSGTYFYYNKSTCKYEFHSQVDLSYYTPATHDHPDRSHGSHRHSYSDKYPARSPDHSESSSGKKKKKKESRRRSSDEKEPKREDKKKKRKKDKSRHNSGDSNEEMDKKKRKKSSDNQPFNQIIDDINQKLKDHSNVVMGELNYKKLKQSDKLLQDSMKKPKLLNESQTNVSICDDVIKDKGEGSSGGHGLTGKKIKLVLKKKEKEEEKKDDTDLSKNTLEESPKNIDENQSCEKDNESNNENNEEKLLRSDSSQKKDDAITHENMEVDQTENVETSTENLGQDNLNQATKLLYNKSMNCSADQNNDVPQTENKNSTQDKTGDTLGQEILKNVSDHEQAKVVPDQENAKEIPDQENTGNILNPEIGNKHFVDKDKSHDDQSTTNPFLISGFDAEDGMFSYDSVGIADNEEILRICSKLNSEKSPQESNPETDAKDDSKVSTSEKVTSSENLNENFSDKNLRDASENTCTGEKKVDKENVDNVTNEMLGVNENERTRNMLHLKERIVKLPVESGKDGGENDYSDDDDIMIIEKEEEKILIELDSDDDEDKMVEKETVETDIFPKNRKWDLEPGEITDSTSTDSSSSSSSEEPDSQVQPTWVEIVRQPAPASEESALKNAPCIRAMVTSSDFLDEGMLFIVTIEGGIVGRDKQPNLVICVPDINVSKVHAEIRYNRKEHIYSIQDKGSQNGTYVNEERLSEAKCESKWKPLKHEDTLQISCTRFDLHIHNGTDTCDKCEPGQVIASKEPETPVTTDTKDKKLKHREQLKNIKKKYGLVSSSYTDNSAAINNPLYQDKAKERRQIVGSDNPHKMDDFPSSVHRPIQEDNKGHRLLKKMGWSEGESLGKDNAGIQEPINITVRVDRSAGLGAFGKSNEMSMGNIGVVNARRRFMQTQLRCADASKASGSDSTKKQPGPKLWVQGPTQNFDIGNEDSNKDENK